MILQVLLDADGVLVNFFKGALKIHGITDDPYLLPKSKGKEHIHPLVGMSWEQFWEPLDIKFWRDLEWMPDGHEILELVESEFGAENVCLLTNPSECPMAVHGKMLWVRHHMPQYASRLLMGAGKHFCAHPRRILIDDFDKNVKLFRSHGGTAVMVPRAWNELHQTETLPYLREELRKVKNYAAAVFDV